MPAELYHHGEILDAICNLCTGAVALSQDVQGEATVRVGSNRLFAAGCQVEVADDTSTPEVRTVVGTEGLTLIALDEALEGEHMVARDARIRLLDGELPGIAWVGRGLTETGPRPFNINFPCVIAIPERLDQPMAGGTNRCYEQDYTTSVYYARRRGEGEDEEELVLEEVGRLFNLLMSDPYLSGTCWFAQVRTVEYHPAQQAPFDRLDIPVRCVRIELLARRSQLAPGD